MPGGFTVNTSLSPQHVRVGAEENPVIVIDDVLQAPETLVDFAATTAKFGVPKNHYPGLRAEPLPAIYVANLIQALFAVVGKAFDLPVDATIDTNSYFGLATTPPDALTTLQRLPHFDTTNGRQIAVLQYLCAAEHGGTSFFRHRATGFESVDEDRQPGYIGKLKEELISGGLPAARYMSGDDRLFEETARFEAKFNRVLIYRSRMLHSGNVNAAAGLSGDPRVGRLTANVFLTYR